MTGTWALKRGACGVVDPGQPKWPAGRAAKITWATTGDVPKVRIQYAVNSWTGMLSSWVTIVEDLGNSGNYRWQVPADLTPDTRYYLRVSATDNAAVFSDSQTFEIVPPSVEE